MKKIFNRKISKLYYVAFAIIVLCAILFVYDKIAMAKVKDSHDIKTSIKYDILPDDILIKNYDSYKKFIKSNLNEKEYKTELSDKTITSESFNKYDYIAIFYESRMCNNKGYLNKLTMSKNKMVLSVTRYDERNCGLSTRILFVPINKNEYDELPHIVIKKEVINK